MSFPRRVLLTPVCAAFGHVISVRSMVYHSKDYACWCGLIRVSTDMTNFGPEAQRYFFPGGQG